MSTKKDLPSSEVLQTQLALVDSWQGEPPEQHQSGVLSILQLLHLDEPSLLAAGHLDSLLGKEALSKKLGDESARLLSG